MRGSTYSTTALGSSNPPHPCVLFVAHQLKERVSLRKHQDERLALRSQMSVEEDERRRIEDIKAEEKEKAEVRIRFLFSMGGDLKCAKSPAESAWKRGRV